MANRNKSFTRMSLDTVQASRDAAITIAARLPMLARASMTPTAPPSREMRDMVGEKVRAALLGATSGSLAMGQFWMRAMLGGIRTPMDAVHGLASVTEAALAPARKTVRANARRLSQPGG